MKLIKFVSACTVILLASGCSEKARSILSDPNYDQSGNVVGYAFLVVAGESSDVTAARDHSGITVILADATAITAVTDAKGLYTLSKVSSGTHGITMTKTGYATLTTSVAIPSAGMGVNMPNTNLFADNAVLTGTVTDYDNSPVVNVTIAAEAASAYGNVTTYAVTDNAGKFTFTPTVVSQIYTKVTNLATTLYRAAVATSVTVPADVTTTVNFQVWRQGPTNTAGALEDVSLPSGTWVAQSFVATSGGLRALTAPGMGGLQYEIRTDNGGVPSSTVLGSVTTSGGIDLLSGTVNTTVGTTYWLVQKTGTARHSKENPFSGGSMLASTDSGSTWSASNASFGNLGICDLKFELLY